MPLQNYSLPDSRSGDDTQLTEQQLLQTVVEIARNVFGAAAASIFLIDGDTGELVFEAVAGKGDEHLPGTRFPASTGIAGWVAMSGQPVSIDDLTHNTRFARDAAASTGYVPEKLMAAPLIRSADCIGVLEVLDPRHSARGEIEDLDLLGLLAVQAAICLEILIHSRRRPAAAHTLQENTDLLAQIGDRLGTADAASLTVAAAMLKATVQALEGTQQ